MQGNEDLYPRVVNKYKEEYDVYIGRGSIWGNPYTHITDKKTKAEFIVADRDEAIAMFREYFYNKIESGQITIEQLLSLCSKKLGCTCYPKACHGDVIVEVLKELIDSLQ